MKKYTIDYNTGITEEIEGTLDDAKETAIAGMTYTQQNVDIRDDDGNIVCTSRWYGVEPSEDDHVLEQFGKFGFYNDWEDAE